MNITFTHLTQRRAAGTIGGQYFEALWLHEEGWHMPWWLNGERTEALKKELTRRAIIAGRSSEEAEGSIV